MNPGKMIHRITIQKVSGTRINANKERIPDYKDWESVWSNVKPLQGKEYLEAQKIRAETSYKIDVRYGPITKQIDPTMRIIYKGKTLYIDSVLNLEEKNEVIQIRCYEKLERTKSDGDQ